jgi:hypothetical protein
MNQKGVSKSFFQSETPAHALIGNWVAFHIKNGCHPASSKRIYSAGSFELVVYEYGERHCAVLKRVAGKFLPLTFREWRQPLAVVEQKLIARGWEPIAEKSEVRHAH